MLDRSRRSTETELEHHSDFLQFFFSNVFNDPHSTKQIEDCVGWGMETTAATLIATEAAPQLDAAAVRALAKRISCPTLVIQGTSDAICSHAGGAALAELTGGTLVSLEGVGHAPHARQPVKVNRLLRDFVCPAPPPRRGTSRRRKRALYIASPIGLGHAQRDLAVADELRRLHPDLEIDWLAQHPVTPVLEARAERIHPASAHLASESHHIESEAAEHDLHCFQALRRMDEILLANFMVFHDLVGEAALTTDYNAEMIEQIARYPRVRDRAIFVGNESDIVSDCFGAGLPPIREWTKAHYDLAGYVTGFDPAEFSDRERIRAELGDSPDEQVCIVPVGGSGVGQSLLRRVIHAYQPARQRVPNLRMIVVAGPRIDPATLPTYEGVEIRPYVHELYRHLPVCDLAVIQGGLTTAMELTANRRPFLYFPLRHHFEQNFHVRHRLQRYRAGRCMRYDLETSETIAAAIAEEIGRKTDYLPVEADGAVRAAQLIAEIL